MKRQRNTTQMKEQSRNMEVQINEEEIGKLPEKEFRIMIVKIIKNLENKMEKMQESINKHLEKAMAPYSSTLAWKIPWTEKPGGLQSMGLLRAGHDFTFTFHFYVLEKEMATHSSVLAWRIPGTGEPGGLPSMGSHRVGHD